jgi:hypothetical protein
MYLHHHTFPHCVRGVGFVALEMIGASAQIRFLSHSLTHSPENKREEYYWEYGFIILRHLLLICVELRASFLMS